MILHTLRLALFLPLFQATALEGLAQVDARTDYDAIAYDLALAVNPETETLEGVATIVAQSLVDDLSALQLDLYDLHEVLEVRQDGAVLGFTRSADSLTAQLATPVAKLAQFSVTVHYRGQPKGGGFDGFHWAKTKAGSPWINTACQGLGAHFWYPCKASFFHPEDKPERVSMAITCPADLYGVSNGRLVATEDAAPDWFATGGAAYRTFHWRHDYPLETYSVTLNVAPYVVVESTIEVLGLTERVPFNYYVLPESAEKAALQFKQVPELVRIYSEAFGPFPFPNSKFALVETNFWGMEHSTAIAYGSSYPAWCAEHGEKDRYASRNKWFDYILIHEVAHEWWGNGVSAQHWGHFWIHEGFGTYAEGVYVERTRGREEADQFFAEQSKSISPTKGALYRGDSPTSGEAYTGLIYNKGAAVLNTLRHYIDDDELWWKSVREFNLEYRYGNATTEDFRAVLERNTEREWKRFFKEWVYGAGTPQLKGVIRTRGSEISFELDNSRGVFLLPLDISWEQDEVTQRRRLWIEPGEFREAFTCEAEPSNVRVMHLDRVLGRHEVIVKDEF